MGKSGGAACAASCQCAPLAAGCVYAAMCERLLQSSSDLARISVEGLTSTSLPPYTFSSSKSLPEGAFVHNLLQCNVRKDDYHFLTVTFYMFVVETKSVMFMGH